MKRGTMCCGCGHTFYAEECEVCAAEERDQLRAKLEAAEAKLARVEAVMRDNRAPDGKWYIEAGGLVRRIEAALKDTP